MCSNLCVQHYNRSAARLKHRMMARHHPSPTPLQAARPAPNLRDGSEDDLPLKSFEVFQQRSLLRLLQPLKELLMPTV